MHVAYDSMICHYINRKNDNVGGLSLKGVANKLFNKPEFFKCDLISIQNREDRNIGTEFILQDKESKVKYSIKVDESLQRVKKRLKEQYNGKDAINGVYLSRGMTNIDVTAEGGEWCIDQEDLKYYVFDKNDVLKFIS